MNPIRIENCYGNNTIMNTAYWDRLSRTFEDDVFDVLGQDRKKVVHKYIDEFADENAVAADFGCGVGRHIPLLAQRFAFVYGVDISGKCVRVAQKQCANFDNASILKADLTSDKLNFEKARFGLAVNLLIMPSAINRSSIMANMAAHLYRGAHFLMVVPSLESVLYAESRLIQWNLKDGLTELAAAKESLDELSGDGTCLPAGILRLGGTPTKHYLEEELLLLCKEHGLKVLHIEKVTYPWSTEFSAPPKWMNEPYPWDWLVVARKA
jgi:SAM-dependent methyltransferase